MRCKFLADLRTAETPTQSLNQSFSGNQPPPSRGASLLSPNRTPGMRHSSGHRLSSECLFPSFETEIRSIAFPGQVDPTRARPRITLCSGALWVVLKGGLAPPKTAVEMLYVLISTFLRSGWLNLLVIWWR